jgi:hypothetical protein
MGLGSGIRDPGSGIRETEKTYSGSRIPDPGVKKAPDPGSGSAILLFENLFLNHYVIHFIIYILALQDFKIAKYGASFFSCVLVYYFAYCDSIRV